MTTNRIPSTSPSQAPRRRRPRHPALRTRRGIAVGAVVATAGLTAAYALSGVGAATSASSSGSSGSSSGSSSSSSSYTADDSAYDDGGSSYDSSSSNRVDVASSSSAPDTQSSAS